MIDKNALDELYNSYNDRRYVHPDPLEFLYKYEDTGDREAAGLIASSLAYGQVKQILKSVSAVLDPLGPGPAEYLRSVDIKELENRFLQFKHRFTTGAELSVFLHNIGQVIKKYNSLNECFNVYFENNQDMPAAIMGFSRELRLGDCNSYNSLMPLPDGKCAYKRVNLYLRWMVRKDNVDPGGWDNITPSKLIVPVDIHMHRFALQNGFTERKQADMKTAIEITEGFKKLDPEDPVKYDFALTRAGIHSRNAT